MRRENHKHMATWLWLESRAPLKLKILHWLILSSWPRGKTIWLLNILHVFKCLQGCLKLLAGLRTTSMRGSTNQSSMASDSVTTNLPVWLWSSLFDKTTSSHKKVAQLLPASQVLSLQDMNRKDDYPLFLRHINNMAGGSDSIAVCFAYICLLLILPLWSLFSLSLGPEVDKHANSVLACVKSTGKKIKCAHSNTLSIYPRPTYWCKWSIRYGCPNLFRAKFGPTAGKKCWKIDLYDWRDTPPSVICFGGPYESSWMYAR